MVVTAADVRSLRESSGMSLGEARKTLTLDKVVMFTGEEV